MTGRLSRGRVSRSLAALGMTAPCHPEGAQATEGPTGHGIRGRSREAWAEGPSSASPRRDDKGRRDDNTGRTMTRRSQLQDVSGIRTTMRFAAALVGTSMRAALAERGAFIMRALFMAV